MDREQIIEEMARTLFVCAWADGVENGEIAGEGPGPGGDWMDAAPVTFEYVVKESEPRNATARIYSEEARAMGDADRVALAHGARLRIDRAFSDVALAQWDTGCRGVQEVRVRRVAVPDPEALAEARRIADAFDRAALHALGVDLARGDTLRQDETPLQRAASIHSELSGTDRFAHSLSMQALGTGVGLEDDMPSGVKLPGWIRASVPYSDFSYPDLDPVRYPAPERTEDEDES